MVACRECWEKQYYANVFVVKQWIQCKHAIIPMYVHVTEQDGDGMGDEDEIWKMMLNQYHVQLVM